MFASPDALAGKEIYLNHIPRKYITQRSPTGAAIGVEGRVDRIYLSKPVTDALSEGMKFDRYKEGLRNGTTRRVGDEHAESYKQHGVENGPDTNPPPFLEYTTFVYSPNASPTARHTLSGSLHEEEDRAVRARLPRTGAITYRSPYWYR